jgi:type IV pilus assembly protein PilE
MNKTRGFTLIELMVTVVIVAILASIALPNYRSQIIKTRRATAEACLVELSQYMERTYNASLRYDKKDSTGSTATTLPSATEYPCQNELTDYYTFALDPTKLTAKTFTLTAAPKTPAQTDNQCGTLSLDQTGVKGVSTGDENVRLCWK